MIVSQDGSQVNSTLHNPASEPGRNGTYPGAWAERAAELAEFFWPLVNRTDVWGGYHAVADRKMVVERNGVKVALGKTTTRPVKSKRGQIVLTPDHLRQHFRATDPRHLVGLHTTAPDNTSRWGGPEIDWHGEDSTAPEVNRTAALVWHRRLEALELTPLLTDSNGHGGYHLEFLLAGPGPTAAVYRFLQWLVSDHAAHGLPAAPELFPKQPQVRAPGEKGSLGNWLRLPGMHHTNPHWSRVWDGTEFVGGDEAVEFILSLKPAPVETLQRALAPLCEGRIRAYAAKLPHLQEGQGRDDAAFKYGAFLVRDLWRPDDEALRWLVEWDAGNKPPKGEDRLREILGNAHAHGQNAYGAGFVEGPRRGISGEGRAAAAVPNPDEVGGEVAEGWVVIRDYFRRRYGAGFRRGDTFVSGTEERQVIRQDACAALPPDLIAPLGQATNAPTYKGGGVNTEALPGFFRKWAGTGWLAFLGGLPEEDHATESDVAIAKETFLQLVRQAMVSEFTLARKVRDSRGRSETVVEQRSAIDWCVLFAKPGPWKTIRSKKLWCRLEERDGGEVVLQVALHHEVFAQLRADRRLTGLKASEFNRRAGRYGVGRSGRGVDRPGGRRAFVLADDFVADLIATFDDDAES
jgi:hypothetical protein